MKLQMRPLLVAVLAITLCAGVQGRRLKVDEAACSCIYIYDPVCDTATGTQYGNACLAACAGVEDTVPGECPTPFTGCAAVLCAALSEPRCVISTEGQQVVTTTFPSPCEAGCSIDPQYVLGSYNGNCSRSADGACARSVVAGSTYCVSSPAHTGEYPSTCYAEKLGCPRGGCTNYSGRCVGDEAIALFQSAPCLSPGVQCLVDPCAVASCPLNPSAVCVSSYCTTFFRNDLVNFDGSCEAVFIDPATGNIEYNCHPPEVVVDQPAPAPAPAPAGGKGKPRHGGKRKP